jgi:hypothetical protein
MKVRFPMSRSCFLNGRMSDEEVRLEETMFQTSKVSFPIHSM